jgi:hypothetical protein
MNMAEGKKLGKRIEKKSAAQPVKLSDEAIQKVSGDFVEHEGYAVGHEIICPNCGNEYEPNFVWWMEDGCTQNGYCCQVCGATFWVSDDGYYYDDCDNMIGYVSY